MPTYQLRGPSSGLTQSILMATTQGAMQTSTSGHQAEEITRKREVRLMKNRYADVTPDGKNFNQMTELTCILFCFFFVFFLQGGSS